MTRNPLGIIVPRLRPQPSPRAGCCRSLLPRPSTHEEQTGGDQYRNHHTALVTTAEPGRRTTGARLSAALFLISARSYVYLRRSSARSYRANRREDCIRCSSPGWHRAREDPPQPSVVLKSDIQRLQNSVLDPGH